MSEKFKEGSVRGENKGKSIHVNDGANKVQSSLNKRPPPPPPPKKK